MNAKDTPATSGTVDVSLSGDLSQRRAIPLHLFADTTDSQVTFLDVTRGKTWTTLVVGWDLDSGKAVVLDAGTARLELVEVMDEARERIACVWSSSTIIEGEPMSLKRAEAMLRGHDDKGGPPPLRIA